MILKDVWEESVDVVNDTEMKAKIIGVASQMQKFEFSHGVYLGYLLLRHTDNLSRTLQNADISASDGQTVAAMTVKTLQAIRTDQSFDMFWEKVTRNAHEKEVDEALVPRKRKVPRRYDDRQAAHEFPPPVEDHYRRIYFEALDLIVACINDRFDQPGYTTYRKLHELVLKAANNQDYKEYLATVSNFYWSDFNADSLEAQLAISFAEYQESSSPITFQDVVKYMKGLSTAQKELFSEVATLVQLILVMPATNAESERSFNALRRVKTYLRAIISQERPNHLMLLHIHHKVTDKLDLVKTVSEFVSGSEHRLVLLERFS